MARALFYLCAAALFLVQAAAGSAVPPPSKLHRAVPARHDQGASHDERVAAAMGRYNTTLKSLKGRVACTEEVFETFVLVHGKTYLNVDDRQRRFRVFCDNMARAHALQQRNPHAQMGVTQFSDMTRDEFSIMISGKPRAVKHSVRDWAIAARYAKNLTLPSDELSALRTKVAAGAAIDWRARGAVTGVKNQGTCGSCWSFSTTGNIEGVWAINRGQLIALSEEELVACVPNQGCGGGSMDTAWAWLLDTQRGGITGEANYPYVSGQGYIPACPAGGYPIVAGITSYGNLAQYDEPQMASYVYSRNPISVGVDADSWQTYNGGVLTSCEAEQMNHAVLVIGFDTSFSPAYWTIKNSWGPGWGESGYIRIAYGENACMVSTGPCSSVTN